MLLSHLVAAISPFLLAQATPDPCSSTAGHRGYTILVQSSGQISHCRTGESTDTPSVSGERVVLQLPPVGLRDRYRFRLVDPAILAKPTHHRLFRREISALDRFKGSLNDLAIAPRGFDAQDAVQPNQEGASLGEPSRDRARVSQTSVPTGSTSPALRAATQRRLQYLQVVTPAFSAAFHKARQDLLQVENAVADVESACAAKSPDIADVELREAIAHRCAAGGTREPLAAALAAFEGQIDAFVSLHQAARAALDELAMQGESGSSETAAHQAALALQRATVAASALVEGAPQLVRTLDRFARDVKFLQVALSISPAVSAGERLVLGRFPAAGLFSRPVIYQLHLAREVSPIFDSAGPGEAEATSPPASAEANEVVLDRIQPVGRRLFSLEVALMYSQGLPDHPGLLGRLGQQTLAQVPTQGFEGGILASLEPLEFVCAQHPWAGLLRFPTIIVPFTLNPLENYFIGGGIGWNDVGSLSVGTHLALTRQPGTGTPYGTQFSSSPIDLNHVTDPGPLRGGYFVSLSLDLLGMAHLFFEDQQPVVRDVYSGREVGAH